MIKYFVMKSRFILAIALALVIASGCLDNDSVAALGQSEPTPISHTASTPTPTPTPTSVPEPTPTPTPIPTTTPDFTPAPTTEPTRRPHSRPRPTATPTPTPTPAPVEVSLIDRPHVAVGNADWFVTSGTRRNNAIWLNPRGTEQFSGTHINYVEYWLGMHASALRATLTPPPEAGSREITMVYRVRGYFPDRSSRLLYTSPAMTSGSALVPINVNIRGAEYMRIELEVNFIDDPAPGFPEQGFPGGYRGIENAVILTTDY